MTKEEVEAFAKKQGVKLSEAQISRVADYLIPIAGSTLAQAPEMEIINDNGHVKLKVSYIIE